MRKDLKHVIIDTGRSGGDSEIHVDIKGRTEEQLDLLPEQQGLRRRYAGWGRSQGDRLGPMTKFLRSRVGKPWDKVWSEICEHADARNIRGYHLREHIQWEVTGSGGEESLNSWGYRRMGFYVDDGGFLREAKDNRRYRYNPRHDPDRCMIGETCYERINGCWFEVKYSKKPEISTWTFNPWTLKHERGEFNEAAEYKRQLSGKDLKRLGLSNEPGWDWKAA